MVYLLAAALIFVTATATSRLPHISSSFHSFTKLQHLAFEPTSGVLFVGATNRLYQLDSKLRSMFEVRTGPVLDDQRCTEAFGENLCSAGGAAKYEAASTDNINKVLVIDAENRQLVMCGSVFQGICQTRMLSNISSVRDHYAQGNTDYFIAANDPHASTVAFSGPGPESRHVLYVATSYTGTVSLGTVRQTVPAVSSRDLVGSNAFRIAYMDGLTGGTLVRLRREAVEKYPIAYVAGFSVAGFSYFVSVQPETFQLENSGFPPVISSTKASKIIQVCQNDHSFYSYVEIPLRCRSAANSNYKFVTSATVTKPASSLADRLHITTDDYVLLAVFSDTAETGRSSRSALCLYRFVDVRAKFTENIQKCFTGGQRYVGSQFSNRLCVPLAVNISSTYCGEKEQNGPLVGSIPLESSTLMESSEVQLTSVLSSAIDDVTVAFLGTAEGHLKKVVLEGDGSVREYLDVVVDAGLPVRKMEFNANKSQLYVMTENRIAMVPVSNCGQFSSCETCRASRDPYCGWCSLERKCSTKASCSFASRDNFWLSRSAWECIRIPSQFVNPVHISIKRNIQVAIGIKALPVLQGGDRYLCVFGSNLSISEGIASPNEVKCQTPKLSSSIVPFNRDHINMTLSIRSVQTGVDFVDTTVTFFDCSQHKSCTSCSKSTWECFWCISRNSCTHTDEVADCPEVVVDDQHRCPRLRRLNSWEILIPAGVPQSIPLSGVFLPAVQVQNGGYECLVHLTAPPIRVPARRLSTSLVTCDAYEYNYLPEESVKTVSLEVIWNGGYVIDDNYGITVVVFKCDMMADDCSTCLSLQEMPDAAKYGCQWCNDRCMNNATCGGQAATTCPLPDIQEVKPLTGPLEGDTKLTIRGMNLGRNYGQVQRAVTVAGIPCEVLPSEYVISRLIVCRTGRVTSPRRGNIVVTIGDATVSWESDFIYQNPQLTRITPAFGPRAGGTRLTIEGLNLDTGARIEVLLYNLSCHINSVNRTEITCTTPPRENTGVLPVTVRFDELVRDLDTDFEYLNDPSITNIQPLMAFRSGGRIITVTGTSLNSVRRPTMNLILGTDVFSSECMVKSSTAMRCLSPQVDDQRRRSHRSTAAEATISFTMDSVKMVRNLVHYFPAVRSTFTLHPNPTYSRFESGRRIYKGEALILSGHNLNLACDAEEVTVWIGNETCKVNSLDLATLYCIPPISQPSAVDSSGGKSGLPLVKVVVGNLVFPLGHLEYQKTVVSDSEYWIIGVAVGGGFLLTVIFIILVIYKRKSTHAVRQFKKLNTQLDALESNIRNECKQAFAELQTEVSDFTSDLNDIGIPFWDYKTYTFKVLFPTLLDHPLLHTDMKGSLRNRNNRNYGLVLFAELLRNSQFLVVFVKTLEEQKNFTIRDKARVASLLMIIFHDQMEYTTEILKILLNDLIDRSVEKKHPKLMLRRTESVVEKILTNWLSICMYGYIKVHAGRTMYMLFKAIKHQTEKGPIDAVTADARYALSEDRLLREKIEARSLMCFLVLGQFGGETVGCKMLDCDTITQAKEKSLDAIYRNTPFSRRPSVHDLDLAWQSGRHVRLLLQDEDNSSVVVNSWKKLNTLGHYEVPDGASMALISRQNKLDISTHLNGTSDISNGLLPSVTTPILAVEENSKLFHLVPQHDDGQHTGRSQKVISEIFLTRLLATKCTLQQYVDDLFCTILRVEGTQLSTVKYLFDFLDAAAVRHGITDPDVVHTWKSNSLLLRFWVNIIKNPEFVFDISKSHIVDSCLSVITQTFMDSCSTHDQRLGKDSPSSKLLFAKDISRYRRMVTQFYREIQELPSISDEEMANALTEQCRINRCEFNTEVALQELYNFARQYSFELLESLDDDLVSRKQQLSGKFEQMSAIVERSSA